MPTYYDECDDRVREAVADERARIRAEIADAWRTCFVLDDVLAIIDGEDSEPQCGNPFCENGYDEMNNEPCACSIDGEGSDE